MGEGRLARRRRCGPRWFQLGGEIDDIINKLHKEREKGNITSDISYRGWAVSGDSTINIWCGKIDNTGEGWIEVKAKIDGRVDTEIANKIMRALGIRKKAEDTRVETELINGEATRKMHATVSKKSAEQITSMTFKAHDERLKTQIKIIFGGKSGAGATEVDGSEKKKTKATSYSRTW